MKWGAAPPLAGAAEIAAGEDALPREESTAVERFTIDLDA
jgi:hypothetical protein